MDATHRSSADGSSRSNGSGASTPGSVEERVDQALGSCGRGTEWGKAAKQLCAAYPGAVDDVCRIVRGAGSVILKLTHQLEELDHEVETLKHAIDARDPLAKKANFFLPRGKKVASASQLVEQKHKEMVEAKERLREEQQQALESSLQDAVVCTLGEVSLLSPRGAYIVEVLRDGGLFLHNKAKTKQVILPANSIRRILKLAAPGRLLSSKSPQPGNALLVLCLKPESALAIGKSTYPFIIMQWKPSLNVTLDVNRAACSESQAAALPAHLSGEPSQQVLALLSALVGCPVEDPGERLMKGQSVGCIVKAHDGRLFPLESGFFFMTKPVTLIDKADVEGINCSRASSTSNRTVDLVIQCKGGQTFSFDMIERKDLDRLNAHLSSMIKFVKKRREEQGAGGGRSGDVSDGCSGSGSGSESESEDSGDDDDDDDDCEDDDDDDESEYDSNKDSDFDGGSSGSDDDDDDDDDDDGDGDGPDEDGSGGRKWAEIVPADMSFIDDPLSQPVDSPRVLRSVPHLHNGDAISNATETSEEEEDGDDGGDGGEDVSDACSSRKDDGVSTPPDAHRKRDRDQSLSPSSSSSSPTTLEQSNENELKNDKPVKKAKPSPPELKNSEQGARKTQTLQGFFVRRS